MKTENNISKSTDQNKSNSPISIPNEIHQRLQPIVSYPEVLTVKQASQFLSLSTSTVYTYISKRKIPYVKRNGVVWLLKSRLMEWLLEGEKKTFAELSR